MVDHCPQGHPVPADAVFCSTCGDPLKIVCTNGHEMLPGDQFCIKCRAVPYAPLPVPTRAPRPGRMPIRPATTTTDTLSKIKNWLSKPVIERK